MKKRVTQMLSALLCVALLAGNAFAFGSDAFREKNGDALETKGVYLYGMHEFREGLMPVLVRNDWNYELDSDWVPETVWNYIDENLNIVDLNKGRFTYVFPFFEGLAAVIGDGGVGYIDKTGKIVIPCGFSTYDTMGTVYTGYFKGGTAPVLKEYVNADPFSGATPTYQVGRIDRTGKLVQEYTEMGTLIGQSFVSDVGDRLDVDAEPVPETTLNQSTYQTTSFETVNPTGKFDSIASYHQANYKLENKTNKVDRVDIAVIPCVLGADFDFDGRDGLTPNRYYPLPIVRIQTTLQPGEVVRQSFSPQWGWPADMLKYVVIKLDAGDMELLEQNAIGVWDKKDTFHPSGRTASGNQLASDFVHKNFADYLK